MRNLSWDHIISVDANHSWRHFLTIDGYEVLAWHMHLPRVTGDEALPCDSEHEPLARGLSTPLGPLQVAGASAPERILHPAQPLCISIHASCTPVRPPMLGHTRPLVPLAKACRLMPPVLQWDDTPINMLERDGSKVAGPLLIGPGGRGGTHRATAGQLCMDPHKVPLGMPACRA